MSRKGVPLANSLADEHQLSDLYFAYGSNMKTEQMQQRVPSAQVVGTAKLHNKCLLFNKQSIDGSGKCNLEDDPRNIVWGILYTIEMIDLPKLDRIEGGYERLCLSVECESGEIVTAFVYTSNRITPDPRPYDWYKVLVIEGACEHQLPAEYIQFLERFPSRPEPR